MTVPETTDSPGEDRLIQSRLPGVFLAIGTFAAVPYIHLHLESRRRFYPDVPCLVHDDASPFGAQLQELCVAYGAHFFSPRERLPPQCGDLSTILLAIQSAQSLNLDLAVKMSRRFIPLTDWVPQLQHTAYHTQYATYSDWDEGHGFGFRSECVAFHAPTWAASDTSGRIERAIDGGSDVFGFVEAFIHGLSREAHARTQCGANREYERLYPRDPDTNAYGIWQWLGHNRKVRQTSFLWHDPDTALDYFRLSQAYGLSYRYEAFADPNMGCGNVP